MSSSQITNKSAANASVEFCMLTACQCEYIKTLKWGCRLSRDPHEPMLLQQPIVDTPAPVLVTPVKGCNQQCPGCCSDNNINCIITGIVEDINTLHCRICKNKYQFVDFNYINLNFADNKNKKCRLQQKINNNEIVDNDDDKFLDVRRELFCENDPDDDTCWACKQGAKALAQELKCLSDSQSKK